VEVERLRRVLSVNPGLIELVYMATLAVNRQNTQPWRFRVKEAATTLLPHFTRREKVLDFVVTGDRAEMSDASRSGELQDWPIFNPARGLAWDAGHPARPFGPLRACPRHAYVAETFGRRSAGLRRDRTAGPTEAAQRP
jgi:hypothetical protein